MLPRGRIPDQDRLVPASTDNFGTIRAEAHGRDTVRVPPQRGSNLLSCLGIPDSNRIIFVAVLKSPATCYLFSARREERERGVFIGSTNRIDSKESPRRRRCRRRPSDVTAANYSFCACVRACVCIYMYIPIIQFLSSKLPQYPLDSHL